MDYNLLSSDELENKVLGHLRRSKEPNNPASGTQSVNTICPEDLYFRLGLC